MVHKFKSITATPAELAAIEKAIAGAMRASRPAAVTAAPKQPLSFAERSRGDLEPTWDLSVAEVIGLGTDKRGAIWFTAPERIGQLQGFEYQVLTDQVILTDWSTPRGPGVWVTTDGEGWVATRQWPAGTFERRTTPKDDTGRDASFGPADLCAEYWRLLKLPGSFSLPGLIARARRDGVLIGLNDGRTHAVRWYQGGRSSASGYNIIGLLDLAEPLVVADLTGQPAMCAVEGCRAEPHAAVTMAAVGVAWCGQDPEQAPKGARPEPAKATKVDRLKAAVGMAG